MLTKHQESLWPGGKQFAITLIHDIETTTGLRRCERLANLEKKLSFRSAFYFTPGNYQTPSSLRNRLISQDFEIGIHGLYHDGKMHRSLSTFKKRAKIINQIISEWNVKGYSSPSMRHNLEWTHLLDIDYDISTFDVDPFEPQPGGVGTILPFIVSQNKTSSFVEIPHTLPQDFTLYILLREKTINLWKKKLDWIVEQGGMALLNVHPDYLAFDRFGRKYEQFPVEYYTSFLRYVRDKYEGSYWNPLPRELCSHVRNNAAYFDTVK